MLNNYLKHILVFVCLIAVIPSFGFQKDAIMNELEFTISKKDVYIQKKNNRIATIKKQLGKHVYYEDQVKIYQDNLSLFKEYRSFDYDSAYYYLDQAKSKALLLKDTLKLYNVKIKEGFVLMLRIIQRSY